MNHDEDPQASAGADRQSRRVTRSGAIIVALAVLGLAGYLVTDHWPHVLAALPYAAIIVVVGVHLFGHRGHSQGGHSHGGHDHRGSRDSGPSHSGRSDTRPDRRAA